MDFGREQRAWLKRFKHCHSERGLPEREDLASGGAGGCGLFRAFALVVKGLLQNRINTGRFP